MAVGYTQQELIDLFSERFSTYALDPKAHVLEAELQLARAAGRSIDDPHLIADIIVRVIIDIIDVNNKKIADQLGI